MTSSNITWETRLSYLRELTPAYDEVASQSSPSIVQTQKPLSQKQRCNMCINQRMSCSCRPSNDTRKAIYPNFVFFTAYKGLGQPTNPTFQGQLSKSIPNAVEAYITAIYTVYTY